MGMIGTIQQNWPNMINYDQIISHMPRFYVDTCVFSIVFPYIGACDSHRTRRMPSTSSKLPPPRNSMTKCSSCLEKKRCWNDEMKDYYGNIIGTWWDLNSSGISRFPWGYWFIIPPSQCSIAPPIPADVVVDFVLFWEAHLGDVQISRDSKWTCWIYIVLSYHV
jgi:hypothetical protein